jgi:DNA processing protein
MTWPQITAEVADVGSALAVWDKLRPQTLFDSPTATKNADDPLKSAREEVALWRNAAFEFMTFRDETYPAQLREVHQIPPVLFTRGTLKPGEAAISVVGSRKASNKALDIARDIAKSLAALKITVLSGLAEGIDTAAHRAAVDAHGRTVAVIGTGISRNFPAANKDLQEQVAREGLVLSQFWPDSPPTKQSFPIRNATMSAYGQATIIVEAGEQSGARIQARSAVAHGRPVILLDSVVLGTNWGRSLRNQPGVFIAANADEAVERVSAITSSEDKVAKLLAMVNA